MLNIVELDIKIFHKLYSIQIVHLYNLWGWGCYTGINMNLLLLISLSTYMDYLIFIIYIVNPLITLT